MKYFSYSDDVGFDTHETEEKAKAFALLSLESYSEEAHDGWDEEVRNICWGQLTEHIVEEMLPAEPKDSDFDYMCDYKLEPFPDKDKKSPTIGSPFKALVDGVEGVFRCGLPALDPDLKKQFDDLVAHVRKRMEGL